jgi:NADH:ubiquinone oxidoreductase subunit F (NADH-binding)/(2Fe-2S) ferredoxin/Pyruvate/2-oxoacid:ferredoxin oxidoreductase delta subunit
MPMPVETPARETVARWTVADLERVRRDQRSRIDDRLASRREPLGGAREILVCAGGACMSCHSEKVAQELEASIERIGIADQARVVRVGCMGLCDAGPLLLVVPDGVYYPHVDVAAARRIVEEHLVTGRPVEDLELAWTGPENERLTSRQVPFFASQLKIALRNCGVVDPLEVEDYVAAEGFAALAKVVFEMTPEQVLDELKASGLRGRGGAGFPSGLKWQFVHDAPGRPKYVVCNADEGDPGAFMDRSILEGDPLSVVEAMTIAGRVVGAAQGYVYVRAEYPLAIERLGAALVAARDRGLLGRDILGSGFDFDVEIRIGAGAFVCGEETALMNSIEGKRGMPRPRPPFPAQKGLYGCPTLLSNVETWANVPQILLRGSSWYAGIGTRRSTGTKVFALAGAVRNTGLVEVPMGLSLREVVETIGGGVPGDGTFKAAQSGGPSGGCVPATAADVPIDFESLQSLGAIMGSGGLVVMDDRTCMVKLARFFLEFCVDESCGKCPPCRIGTKVMLNILDRICEGEGEPDDLDRLARLAHHVQQTSLCGLGQTAPNPTLSTLSHFRDEYLAHIIDRTCPAKECYRLVRFVIETEKCNGCGLCAKSCPVDAIFGQVKQTHVIDPDLCIHCGACLSTCPTDAVTTA